jgi:hypothetical protein
MQLSPGRPELAALAGQNWPPLLLYTENVLRKHPPQATVLHLASVVPIRDSEEDDGMGVDPRAQEIPERIPTKPSADVAEAHIARCVGPPLGDLAPKPPIPAPEAKDGLVPFWAAWVEGWDGSPPLPSDSERGQDLQTLRNDFEREGPEVLVAAIRAGRELQRVGRLRLFDLRRYCCSSIRSTCILRGRAEVDKAKSERLEAAKETRRSDFDAEVARRLRDARARGENPYRREIEEQVRREL